jgi:hypothetical protein
VCLAYYFLDNYRFQPENARTNFTIVIATWFSALFIWGLFRAFSLSGNTSLSEMILSELKNFPVLLMYIGKALLPFNISVYPTLKDSSYLFGVIAVILIGAAFLKTEKFNWKRLALGSLWFLIFLLPSFIRPNNTPADFLEHRLYLPIIGLFIVFAEIYPLKNINWQDKTVRIVTTLIILLFSALTFWHSRNFIDRLSFWNKAALDSPQSAFVNNNLGAMYHLDNNLVLAQKYYLSALQLDPTQSLVHNNLGLIAVKLNKPDVAEAEYRQEILINPNYDTAWVNLGLLYLKTKHYHEAADSFKIALKINPNNILAYRSLLILGSKVE